MRVLALVCCGLAVGCGGRTGGPEPADAAPAGGKREALPADLGTRRGGVDWPCFLGPRGDSTSPEKGILAPWPKSAILSLTS